MAEPLLTKDSVNVLGHKFPIALIGGLAAVVMVVLVIRSRSKGGAVSAGSVPASAAGPYTAAATGFGGNFSPDYSGALANLSQQLTTLSQTGISAPAAPVASAMTVGALPGFPASGYGTIPLYLNPGGPLWSLTNPTASGNLPAWLPWSTQVKVTGAPVTAQGQTFEQVSYGGVQGFVPLNSFQSFQGI